MYNGNFDSSETKQISGERITLDEMIGKIRELSAITGSQLSLAERMGVSAQFLSDIVTGRRLPGPKIFDFFGVEKVVEYILIEPTVTIDDGFDSKWSAHCEICGCKTMYVVRPGLARCSICDG